MVGNNRIVIPSSIKKDNFLSNVRYNNFRCTTRNSQHYFYKHFCRKQSSVAAVIWKWNASPLYRHKRRSPTWKFSKMKMKVDYLWTGTSYFSFRNVTYQILRHNHKIYIFCIINTHSLFDCYNYDNIMFVLIYDPCICMWM